MHALRGVVPLLVIVSALALPASAANLLTNPGFESGVQGTVPTGWTRWNASWSGGYYAITDSYAAYSDNYGLREYITGSASFGVYQEVTVTPGNAYKLNGMWRAVTAGPQNWFEIILLDGAFNIDQADSAPAVFQNVVAGWDANAAFGHPAPANWAWEPFSATYGNEVSAYIENGTRTATGNKMTVVLKIGCASTTKPTVYFDDITLTPVPKATVLAPSTQLTRNGPVTFQVSFTDPVTGFNSPSDVDVIATGTATAGTVTVTGGAMSPYMVTLSDITGGGYLSIRVKANAAQNADGNGNLASEISSPVCVLASDGSIAAVKGMGDGALVELAGKQLHLKQTGLGYIQELDRTAGIRLQGNVTGYLGDKVLLVGTLVKVAGEEPYVQVTTMAPNGGANVWPLGANNAAVRSRLLDGLPVMVWGIVRSVGATSYVISDGADPVGITINTQGPPTVVVGQFRRVIGAAGIPHGVRVVYERASL